MNIAQKPSKALKGARVIRKARAAEIDIATTKPFGGPPMCAIWAKSSTGLKSDRGLMSGASTSVGIVDMSRVAPSGSARATPTSKRSRSGRRLSATISVAPRSATFQRAAISRASLRTRWFSSSVSGSTASVCDWSSIATRHSSAA